MNIRLLPSRFEIYMWSLLISLLSDSEVIQQLVRALHRWIAAGNLTRLLRITAILSIAGFALGFLFGLAGL
jgi:hypothetical protein